MKPTRSRRGEKGEVGAQRRWVRAKLAREARVAERRLRDAVVPNFGGPVLGRANVVYEMGCPGFSGGSRAWELT